MTRLPVLLLAATLLAACSAGDDDRVADGGAAPVLTATQIDQPCPVEADEVLAGQDARTAVPAEPVRARLCLHANGIAVVPGQAPVPRLLTGDDAQALATRYASLQRFDTDQTCTADAGPTATVLLGYPDGTAVAVATDLFGCATSRLAAGQDPPLITPDGDLRDELRRLAG